MFAEIREESSELYVLTNRGAIKIRDYKRKPESERWNQEEFAGIQGLPWELVPERRHVQVKSHFQHNEDEIIVKLPSSRGSIPRRIYIKKDDVSNNKYGLTAGCRGCEAANTGLVGIHSESCRARMEKEIAAKDPETFWQKGSRE